MTVSQEQDQPVAALDRQQSKRQKYNGNYKIYSVANIHEWDNDKGPAISIKIKVPEHDLEVEAKVWETDTIEHIKRFVVLCMRNKGMIAQTSGRKIVDCKGEHLPHDQKVTNVARHGDTVHFVATEMQQM